MNSASATSPVPRFVWRATTLIGLWFIIFGVITALTPWHMESGYDITHEKLKATLCAPILGCLGLAAFLGADGHALDRNSDDVFDGLGFDLRVGTHAGIALSPLVAPDRGGGGSRCHRRAPRRPK